MQESLGIAGSGAIACGLAATAARHADVVLWARSPESAQRARDQVERVCGRLSGEVNASRVRVETDLEAFSASTFVVEAVIEELDAKATLLRAMAGVVAGDAVLATTTSSLSIESLAQACGRPERFAGLHVFNPVPKMKLVELVFPAGAAPDVRSRAHALCEALGKAAVEAPDVPGFVVNRLLFPYLFSAVRLREQTGLEPREVDACMTMGAGHPMGPLALLDYVGLDVALAIGEAIGTEIPARVRELVGSGALGKKSGRGFYDYD